MKVKSLITLGVTVLLIVLVSMLALNGLQIGKYIFQPVGEAISLGLDLRGGVYAVYVAKNSDQEDFDTLMSGTISVLRSRLTAKGFTEATVSRQGTNRIRVEIPDIQEPDEVLKIVGTPAHLEFRDSEGNVVITGGDIKLARAVREGSTGTEAVVAFELNESGRQAFAEATARNIGKSISIVLDDKVISAPVVQSVISEGTGTITGMESDQAALDLAALIMSGALPLDIEQDEISAVSATLGVEALDTSVTAGIIGLVLVMVFMVAVYRLPGLIADMALCIYILIVFYLLATVPGVQITLPGIAGVLLGIGMAVDANIIIFERFRDELKSGRSLTDSVKYGFSRAFTAVIDSNLTSIIAALVLMYFGTGSIKGFAIALLISVITSLFSAVFVTRFLLRRVVDLGIDNKALYTR